MDPSHLVVCDGATNGEHRGKGAEHELEELLVEVAMTAIESATPKHSPKAPTQRYKKVSRSNETDLGMLKAASFKDL